MSGKGKPSMAQEKPKQAAEPMTDAEGVCFVVEAGYVF